MIDGPRGEVFLACTEEFKDYGAGREAIHKVREQLERFTGDDFKTWVSENGSDSFIRLSDYTVRLDQRIAANEALQRETAARRFLSTHPEP